MAKASAKAAPAKPAQNKQDKQAPKSPAKTGTQVATTGSAALPAYLQGYKGPLGTEGIDSEDVTIPRLKIGQSMNPEVKEGTVEEGALFLNITGETIWSPGDEPVRAIIVAVSKEYILWRPREDNGGGILARAKPQLVKGVRRYAWDKPNQSFDVKVGGKVKASWTTKAYIDQDGLGDWGSELPGDKDSGIAATAHHNYIVVLPDNDNLLCAISMSRSGVKKARDLNAAIKMRGRVPVQALQWKLSTVDDKNTNGDEFKNWNVKPIPEFVPDAEFKEYDTLAKGFQANSYSVDMTDADADTGGDKEDADPEM